MAKALNVESKAAARLLRRVWDSTSRINSAALTNEQVDALTTRSKQRRASRARRGSTAATPAPVIKAPLTNKVPSTAADPRAVKSAGRASLRREPDAGSRPAAESPRRCGRHLPEPPPPTPAARPPPPRDSRCSAATPAPPTVRRWPTVRRADVLPRPPHDAGAATQCEHRVAPMRNLGGSGNPPCDLMAAVRADARAHAAAAAWPDRRTASSPRDPQAKPPPSLRPATPAEPPKTPSSVKKIANIPEHLMKGDQPITAQAVMAAQRARCTVGARPRRPTKRTTDEGEGQGQGAARAASSAAISAAPERDIRSRDRKGRRRATPRRAGASSSKTIGPAASAAGRSSSRSAAPSRRKGKVPDHAADHHPLAVAKRSAWRSRRSFKSSCRWACRSPRSISTR